jgi:hypothetical protein
MLGLLMELLLPLTSRLWPLLPQLEQAQLLVLVPLLLQPPPSLLHAPDQCWWLPSGPRPQRLPPPCILPQLLVLQEVQQGAAQTCPPRPAWTLQLPPHPLLTLCLHVLLQLLCLWLP